MKKTNKKYSKTELIELIKKYQQIIYMYNQYPNYTNKEYSYTEACVLLEEYNEEYCKLLK